MSTFSLSSVLCFLAYCLPLSVAGGESADPSPTAGGPATDVAPRCPVRHHDPLIDELTEELHPPALEQILSWLQPVPDLPAIVARLGGTPPSEQREPTPGSEPAAGAEDVIAGMEAELTALLAQSDYRRASGLAGELAELCARHYGQRHWKTVDAQSCRDTFAGLAESPESALRFTQARQLQPRIEQLAAQNKKAEARQLVGQRLVMLRDLGLQDHAAAAEDWLSLGMLLAAGGSLPSADLCYRQGIRLCHDHLVLQHPHVATGLEGLAWLHQELGDTRTAETLRCAALAIRLESLGRADPSVVPALANLASLQQRDGGYAAAEQLLSHAQRLQNALPETGSIERATTTYAMAGLQKARGDYSEAERLYRRAMAMFEELGGPRHSGAIACLNNLGSVAWRQGDYASAAPLLIDALHGYYATVGEVNADVVGCRSNLADVFLALGNLRLAEAYARDAVQTAQELPCDRGLLYADSATTLATVLLRKGDSLEAEQHYQRALDIRTSLLGDDHLLVARSQGNLGMLLYSVGDYDRAEKLYAQALATKRRVLGEHHPETGEMLHNLGCLHYKAGDRAEAARRFRQAEEIFRKLPGDGFPLVLEAWHGLAAVATDDGEYAHAEELLRRVVDLETRHGHVSAHRHRSILAELLHRQLNRPQEAIPLYDQAIQDLDQLRLRVGGDELDQAQYATQLRRWRAFGGMARAQLAVASAHEDGVREAFRYLEQGRGRALLGLLDRAGEDVFEVTTERIAESAETAQEIASARRRAVAARARLAAAERQMATTADDATLRTDQKSERLTALENDCKAARDEERLALRRLFDLSRGGLRSRGLRPLDAREVAARLKPGELLLLYDVGPADTLLIALRASGQVTAHQLHWADGTEVSASSLADRVTSILRRARSTYDRSENSSGNGLDLDAELAATLVPPELSSEILQASCLFVIPDGPLCGLPFELLFLPQRGGSRHVPTGPPVVYGPSATVLAMLRAHAPNRSAERHDESRMVFLGVGDPRFDHRVVTTGPAGPERGVLVSGVTAQSNAALGGIQPGDVITWYFDGDVNEAEGLQMAMQRTLNALGQPQTTGEPSQRTVRVQVWRDATSHDVYVAPGTLGITISRAALADVRRADGGSQLAESQRHARLSLRVTRDVLGRLSPLGGTRHEVNAVARLVRASGVPSDLCQVLLGEDATLLNLVAQAEHPQYLHLATHGFANPWQPHESALLFTLPPEPTPADDGFLRLGDLLYGWGGRLEGTELVVLSACHGASGAQATGEGLVALTWGFLFAGADSVLASLWSADDKATALLMHRFYENVLGEYGNSRCGYAAGTPMRKCAALQEAKQWLANANPRENREQLERIGFEVEAGDAEGTPSEADRGRLDTRPGAGPLKLEPRYDYSHPHYWAGFILIGDPE